MGRVHIHHAENDVEIRANLWPGWNVALFGVVFLGGIAALMTWMILSFLTALDLNLASLLAPPLTTNWGTWARWILGNIVFCATIPTIALIDIVALFYVLYVGFSGLLIQRVMRDGTHVVSSLSLFDKTLATRRWHLADGNATVAFSDSSTTTNANAKRPPTQSGNFKITLKSTISVNEPGKRRKEPCIIDKITARDDVESALAVIREWQDVAAHPSVSGERWR